MDRASVKEPCFYKVERIALTAARVIAGDRASSTLKVNACTLEKWRD